MPDKTANWPWRLGFWPPLVVCTWLALTPAPPQVVFQVSDLFLHWAAFCYLTFMLAMAHFDGRWLPVSLSMLSYGALLEVWQSFVATRTPELADLVVDGVGVAMGLLLFRLLGGWSRALVDRVLRYRASN